MPFLTIAGVTVQVTALDEGAPITTGDEGRSFNGALRGDITAERRQWSGVGLSVSSNDYETLRNAVKLGAHVSVAGDAIPDNPRTMRVTLTGGEYVRDKLGFLKVPSFTMEDV